MIREFYPPPLDRKERKEEMTRMIEFKLREFVQYYGFMQDPMICFNVETIMKAAKAAADVFEEDVQGSLEYERYLAEKLEKIA